MKLTTGDSAVSNRTPPRTAASCGFRDEAVRPTRMTALGGVRRGRIRLLPGDPRGSCRMKTLRLERPKRKREGKERSDRTGSEQSAPERKMRVFGALSLSRKKQRILLSRQRRPRGTLLSAIAWRAWAMWIKCPTAFLNREAEMPRERDREEILLLSEIGQRGAIHACPVVHASEGGRRAPWHGQKNSTDL